jgi:predicted nuclease with TOPRIM domain
MSDEQERYNGVKNRIAELEATRQNWLGRKEVHEASKSRILADVRALGFEVSTLDEASKVLEKAVADQLDRVEVELKAAEEKFNSLRSS